MCHVSAPRRVSGRAWPRSPEGASTALGHAHAVMDLGGQGGSRAAANGPQPLCSPRVLGCSPGHWVFPVSQLGHRGPTAPALLVWDPPDLRALADCGRQGGSWAAGGQEPRSSRRSGLSVLRKRQSRRERSGPTLRGRACLLALTGRSARRPRRSRSVLQAASACCRSRGEGKAVTMEPATAGLTRLNCMICRCQASRSPRPSLVTRTPAAQRPAVQKEKAWASRCCLRWGERGPLLTSPAARPCCALQPGGGGWGART